MRIFFVSLICLLTWEGWAASQLPSTSFTRDWLRATNAEDARLKIGITTTNIAEANFAVNATNFWGKLSTTNLPSVALTNNETRNISFQGGLTNTVHVRLDDGKATYTARPGQLLVAGVQTNKTSFDAQIFSVLDASANYYGGFPEAYGAMAWWSRVRDSATVTAGTNTPIIYGLRVDIEPSRARTNSPYDDATGILIENSGKAIATDGLYIGNGGYGTNWFGANNSQWYNLIQLSADADQGVRMTGHYKYGLRLDEGTFTNSAIYLPTNDTTAAITAPTPSTNVVLMDAAYFKVFYDATNDCVWLANSKSGRPLRFTQPSGGGNFGLYPYNFTGFTALEYGGIYAAGSALLFRTSDSEWPPTTTLQANDVGTITVRTNLNVTGMLTAANLVSTGTNFFSGNGVYSGSNTFSGTINVLGESLFDSATFTTTRVAVASSLLMANSDSNIVSATIGALTNLLGSAAVLTNAVSQLAVGATIGAADANALTNLTYLVRTNGVNSGTITVGQTMITNLSGNITLGGFSGLTAGFENFAAVLAIADGSTRTVALPGSVLSVDGARTYYVTNGIARKFQFSIVPGIWTNCACVPSY